MREINRLLSLAHRNTIKSIAGAGKPTGKNTFKPINITIHAVYSPQAFFGVYNKAGENIAPEYFRTYVEAYDWVVNKGFKIIWEH